MKSKMTLKRAVIGTLLLAIFYLLYVLNGLESKNEEIQPIPCNVPRRPVVLMVPWELENPVRILTTNVFTRLGYDVLPFTNPFPIRWDIIWTEGFPFGWPDIVAAVFGDSNPKGKINHFPGISMIAIKEELNTKFGGSKYTPRTFTMPEDRQAFLKELGKNGTDERIWIQKNKQHRDNIIRKTKDLDLDKDSLIQEFIKNQFLLHGHVISLGIMVVITSVSPLRAYTLDSGWMVRITTKPFHPVNYSDTETYVTNAGKTTLYEFRPMLSYFDIGYSRKQALLAHMISDLGRDPVKIQRISEEISDAVQDAIVKRQFFLGWWTKHDKIKKDSNHFEIMRWDFVLDDNLKIYLLEANMSPDLYNSHKLIRAKNENSIYSTLKMMDRLQNCDQRNNGFRNGDVFVDLHICYTTNCSNCRAKECHLCSKCLSNELVEMLKESATEHVNRFSLRRVYPERMTKKDAEMYNASKDRHLPKRDQVNKAWFRAKCAEDIYWCH